VGYAIFVAFTLGRCHDSTDDLAQCHNLKIPVPCHTFSH
jgi:hypothetical protein